VNRPSGGLGVADGHPTRRLTGIAFLAAAGIALFVLESYIPLPLPFMKIGLANVSTVLALMMFGVGAMFAVVGIRVIVGSLLVGTFMSPGFMLAVSAGVCSALLMSLTKLSTRNLFSAFGLSLIGSFTHVFVQLLVVRYAYVQNAAIGLLVPLLLVTALLGGTIVGWVSLRLVKSLKGIPS
jgi:heptaprenyl diphosphate synthase